MTVSRWRTQADRVIAATLAALPPSATEAEARKALRAAYPFGERANYPYQVWLVAQREALKAWLDPRCDTWRPRFVLTTWGERGPWLTVKCPWCDHQSTSCMMCVRLVERIPALVDDPGFRALREAAKDDPLARLALLDWLRERDCEAEDRP